MGGIGRGSKLWGAAGALLGALVVLACGAAGASAALAPEEALTYLPFGFVHSERPAALLDETLEELQSYGIGQALLPLPKLKKTGVMKLSKKEQRMLVLWSGETRSYDALHGSSITLVASLSGKVKGASLNLEEPSVRANVLAAAQSALSAGAGAISLDLEPYPTSQGFVLLLSEIDALLQRRGLPRVAITAPANTARWSPAYLEEVSAQLGEVNPLFYDSERKTAAAYEQWVREGLAYYSAHSAPGARLVPDLPSYGPNRWHDPSVENLTTATTAVEEALVQGSRVNGAGIFWWWGFFYDEEGEGSYDGASDRETWLGRTLLVPFTP